MSTITPRFTRPTRLLAVALTLASGLGLGLAFKHAESEPGLEAKSALAPDIGLPPEAEEALEARWMLDFGPVFEVPVEWLAKQSHEAKILNEIPANPRLVANAEGPGVQLEGVELSLAHPFDVFRVAPEDLSRLIASAQRVDSVGEAPRCALRPSFDPSGLVEYRQVFGHLEGRPADGNYIGVRAEYVTGLVSLKLRGAMWDKRSRPPQWESRAGDGGILEIVETERGSGLLRFKAEDGSELVDRVVGTLGADGTLAIWLESESS